MFQRINICEKNENISQYKGVYWHKQLRKWYVLIYQKGQKQKYGGCFNDELDAAKKVNQFCEEFGITPHNPTIIAIPNQQYEVTKKCFFVSWHCEIIRTTKNLLFQSFKTPFFLNPNNVSNKTFLHF